MSWIDEEESLQKIETIQDTQWIQARQLDDTGIQPVFLVGFPGSHLHYQGMQVSRDRGLIHLGDTKRIDRDLFDRTGPVFEAGFYNALSHLNQDDLSKIRSRYLEALPAEARKMGRFVDVSPFNILHVASLKCMFPQADFVLMDVSEEDQLLATFREPLDPHVYRSSTSIEKISIWIKSYRRLLKHWARTLDGGSVTEPLSVSGKDVWDWPDVKSEVAPFFLDKVSEVRRQNR